MQQIAEILVAQMKSNIQILKIETSMNDLYEKVDGVRRRKREGKTETEIDRQTNQ